MMTLSIISLISVGIAITIIFILGFIVFFSNRKSATSKAFLFFSLITVIWGLLNYLSYQFNSPNLILWILRLVMFFATWQAFSIFTLFYVVPLEKIQFSRVYKFIIFPVTVFTSIFSLTPLVFSGIAELAPIGRVSKTIVGPGIGIFGFVLISFVIGGFFILIKKIFNADVLEKIQLKFMLVGAIATFFLLIIFNFILPGIFLNTNFIPLGAIFLFPFIALTSYAILKHGLFNIKVIATELLVFAIWIVILIELLLTEGARERILDGVVLLFTIIAGIFLIRSVKKEVAQREELEKLSHELQHAYQELKELDKTKSEFLSIVSHQLRTPLSITKGYVSMILEGIYGTVSEKIRETLQKVYVSNEGLIALVNNLLDLSRMEAGTIRYDFKDSDFVKMVDEIVMELDLEAKRRELYLKWEKPTEQMPLIKADEVKLKQVIEILIENSLKYTPKGGVTVSLERGVGSLLFKIQDSGIGINPHEIEHLFSKFGRGKEGQKVNATGMGLGLYAAKQIVVAHKGDIFVYSDGIGKGSTFCVRLPVGWARQIPRGIEERGGEKNS